MAAPHFRRGLTYVDVLVLLAAIVFGISMLLPSLNRTRGCGGNRIKCVSNLKQIGLALLLYANENRGHYPRAAYVAGGEVVPVSGTGAASSDPFSGPAPNDVT